MAESLGPEGWVGTVGSGMIVPLDPKTMACWANSGLL